MLVKPCNDVASPFLHFFSPSMFHFSDIPARNKIFDFFLNFSGHLSSFSCFPSITRHSVIPQMWGVVRVCYMA